MPDSGADYALEALTAATAARAQRPAGVDTAALGASGIQLPALDFRFSSPSFLSATSRWVLFLVLAVGAFAALWVAYRIWVDAPAGVDGIAPTIGALGVALIAFVLSYLTVLGFGRVEIRTTIGEGAGTAEAALTVEATVPGDGATGIGRDVAVEATFSAAVEAGTVTTSSFTLKKRGGPEAVPARVTLDEDGRTARLAPKAPLAANATYDATISTAVKAADGRPLGAQKRWSFTTRT
jgi:hypothetical protein